MLTRIFLQRDYFNYLFSEINAENKRINELKEENSTLVLLISEYESK